MTKKQCEQALARAEKATPGPWYADRITKSGLTIVEDGMTADDRMFSFKCETYEAQFCAHARTDVPALVKAYQDVMCLIEATHSVCVQPEQCPACAAIRNYHGEEEGKQ